MWERYYDDANAIIFVVDSGDIERLEEAKLAYGTIIIFIFLFLPYFYKQHTCIEAILDHESISNVPVLIFANKQDLPGALSPGDLAINFFSLQDSADRSSIYPISALTGLRLIAYSPLTLLFSSLMAL